MIKVTYHYEGAKMVLVSVNGHANFAQLGTDIVCAGISAIVIGTLNALQEMESSSIKIIANQSGLVKFKVINITNNNQVILKTMLWQLKTISSEYPQYINIEEV